MEPEDDGQGFQTDNSQGQETDTGSINPAWNDALEVIPAELHSQVTPYFQKWDQNYQTGINKVHSQYEPYKPIIEAGYQPDQINYAMSVLQAIETQPDKVLEALQAWVGQESSNEQQGQINQQVEPSGAPDITSLPEFQRVNQMVETMAQLLVQQRQSEQQSQADRELEESFKQLRDTHGEFDEEWVLTKLYNNQDMSLEDGVKAYHEFVARVRSEQRRPGPRVLGPGGSVPNQNLDVKKLDSKGTRNLVQQMLQQAAEQNQ